MSEHEGKAVKLRYLDAGDKCVAIRGVDEETRPLCLSVTSNISNYVCLTVSEARVIAEMLLNAANEAEQGD